MQDSERLAKGPLDYEVIREYTGLNGAVMMVGNKISLDENLGSLLCRKGYLKDVTARVADTIEERVVDLETTSASHTSSIAAVVASDALKATDADLTLVENRVTTLEADLATAESDIDSLEDRATTLEDDVADHEERITTLENAV